MLKKMQICQINNLSFPFRELKKKEQQNEIPKKCAQRGQYQIIKIRAELLNKNYRESQ